MLSKIIMIKNVGRFLNYCAHGDVVLKKYNLIFAENGRGKTTLCAVLRSLQTNNSAHVLGRATLGNNNPPEIRLLLGNDTINFNAGTWDATVQKFAIFDSYFVSENVYSGDDVSLDHKRKFYKLIIGKRGVKLARKIEDFDTLTRKKSGEIKDSYAVIKPLVSPSQTVETFLTLQEDPDVDKKIEQKKKQLQELKDGIS